MGADATGRMLEADDECGRGGALAVATGEEVVSEWGRSAARREWKRRRVSVVHGSGTLCFFPRVGRDGQPS